MSYRIIASIAAAALIGIACISTDALARGGRGGGGRGVHHAGGTRRGMGPAPAVLAPKAIWCGRHIHWRRTIVTRGCNRSPNDRSGSETAYQSSRNISTARLDWNGGSAGQSPA